MANFQITVSERDLDPVGTENLQSESCSPAVAPAVLEPAKEFSPLSD